MTDSSKAKNYEFPRMISNFAGYVSSVDKTNVAENVMVRGSQNVYKKLSGTIAVRQGQKRQGVANTTISPCSSEYVWNTSLGNVYTLVVSNSNLYVVINKIWYSLQSGLTATRYVFDKWWDNTLKKDDCLFVNGSSTLQMWGGGVATVSSATASTIVASGSLSWAGLGFTSTASSTIGSSTTQFTITNTSGNTYRYTWTTTGTDPAITATSVPIGTFVYMQAQNFNSANNGLFVVTGVGAGYFEVTNASGVAEATKTIGTGYIYTKYTRVLNIGGVNYAYTGGETTTTLTGVYPDPSATVAGTVVLQAVVQYPNTPASTFNADFLKVINNQVYLGSYTSRLIYVSQNTDFTNYTVPNPRLPGSPELIVLDGTAKGIGVRQGNAHIGFGSGGWAVVSFSEVTVGTTLTSVTSVTIRPVALLQAPYAHEFIDNVGDNLMYLAQDQQVRSFGDFNNLFVSGYPSLSQEIARELTKENFASGSLRCIGEFLYLNAPASGKTYLYQARSKVDGNGNVVAERLWHSPFIWNATAIDQISGVVVAFSNANPQIYEVWDTNQWHDDSPSDENLPYECILAFGYRGEQRRQGLWSFDKQFTEGYITQGTPLNLLMNYNYQGATNALDLIINSVAQPAYTFSNPLASLGDTSLGDEPLGNGGVTDIANDQDSLPKFKVINSMPIINCFEWQPIYHSNSADAQWEILAIATNEQPELEQNATFIVNKKR